jgi:hypothetical protein
MATMSYMTFNGDEKILEEIASDATIKPLITTKISWSGFLQLGLSEELDDQVRSYIMLKYGDHIKTDYLRDFSPVPGVDYSPRRIDKQGQLTPVKQIDL